MNEAMKTHDAIDELAALFLTEEGADTPQAVTGRSAAVELLLVGHLPVRAGLWLGPYADAVARERGCTALVRLDREEPAVQVMRGTTEHMRLPETGLRDVLSAFARQAERWIVRAPDDLPAAEIVKLGADRVTILSSAESSAVVAAYQLIKAMAWAAEEQSDRLPPISIAVLGAEPEQARRMVDRVNQATAAFLDTPVELSLCLQRIDSDIRCTRDVHLSGERCASASDVVQWIRGFARPKDAPRTERQPLRLAVDDPIDSPFVPVVETRHVKLAPKPFREAPSHDAAHVPSTQSDGDAQSSETTAPSLASHVAGLCLLPIQCPSAPIIEIATNAVGELHLLAREQHLRELRIVESWAAAHRSLLVMASRERAILPEGAITLHVFTDQPHTLADLHGTNLCLHVLAPVVVEGRAGWYAAPLSR